MKNKLVLAILIIVIIVLLSIQQYFIFTKDNKDDVFLKKIELIELKLDSLNNKKDSIRTVIDSTHIKIITNEKHYQERINTIITQPDSFSESFTRQYILEYATNHGINIR